MTNDIEYTCEGFAQIAHSRIGQTVKVKGLVIWKSPTTVKSGKWFNHKVIIVDPENENGKVKISVNGQEPEGGYKLKQELYVFSGEVSEDKFAKQDQCLYYLWKGKLLGTSDKIANGKIEHKLNNDNLERHIAPIIGMLYNNAYEALKEVRLQNNIAGHNPEDIIDGLHDAALEQITPQRIQDVLDKKQEFLDWKAGKIPEEDPFDNG